MGNARNLAFWAVLFILILALFNLFGDGQSAMNSRTVSYSDFMAAVDKGEVKTVQLDGEDVRYQMADGTAYSTVKPVNDPIAEKLIEKGVDGIITDDPATMVQLRNSLRR